MELAIVPAAGRNHLVSSRVPPGGGDGGFGKGPGHEGREATPYAPTPPYTASKASADHLVRAYFHTYGLPAIIAKH